MLGAYIDYYRAHGKTYHVKAQWESVAIKGKPIPGRAALVEAMFMAELENLVLTAGHDISKLVPPVRVDVTRDGDHYVLMNGSERDLEAGDMMMADGEAIISSVLYGPTPPASRPRPRRCSLRCTRQLASARQPFETISTTSVRTSCSCPRTRQPS